METSYQFNNKFYENVTVQAISHKMKEAICSFDYATSLAEEIEIQLC